MLPRGARGCHREECLRDEFLNGQLFDSLLEARVMLADWRDEYNHERLRSSHGYLPPVEFNEAWNQQHQQRLSLALKKLRNPAAYPERSRTRQLPEARSPASG